MTFKTSSWAPEQPLPKYADRKTLAAIITHHFFQLAIEHSRHGQSRFVVQIRSAVYEVSEAMEFAQSKLDKSVCYKQGAGL